MYKTNGEYKGIGYADLYNKAEAAMLGFASMGVKRGERIALISENRPEWVIADMGMMHLGAVSVPLYPSMTPKQIAYILNDAGISFAIVSNQSQLSKLLKITDEIPRLSNIIVMSEEGIVPDGRIFTFDTLLKRGEEMVQGRKGQLLRASESVTPDDLLTIIYTSGTTGNPKGVMLSHRNFASNIIASSECLSIEEGDRLLSFLPLCHSFERMAGYYTAMACGATIAYAESVESVSENITEVRPTLMTSVPRLFERMHHRTLKQIDAHPAWRRKVFHWAVDVGKKYALLRRRDGTNPLLALKHKVAEQLVYKKIKERTGGFVRFFVSGGAPLAPELGEFFQAVGLPIIEGYGLSETSPVISVNSLHDFRIGTVGKPIPGIEVKIAQDGEILVRGPNVMKGYWNDAKSTSEVIDGEGFLHTGDIGALDADGFLKITDRKKHLFVSSGGKNVAPQHIENLFLQSKFIDQFVLIGDRRMYCTALIVPDQDALKSRMKVEPPSGPVYTATDIVKFFEEEIADIQKELPNYERVRRFTLLSQPFTVEGGELTPTLKVKRKVVEEKWAEIIEGMYSSLRSE